MLGVTETNSGLLEVVTGAPPLIEYVHGATPVKFNVRMEAPPSQITSPPDNVAVGGAVMVTFCVQVIVLPLASVPVHVTTVVPNENVTGASFETEAPGQLSLTTAVPNAGVLLQLVTSAGQVMVGFSVSVTNTD